MTLARAVRLAVECLRAEVRRIAFDANPSTTLRAGSCRPDARGRLFRGEGQPAAARIAGSL